MTLDNHHKYTLCVYDIPFKSRIPNPSGSFRRYGIRVNLSAWVFPLHLVPHEEINELADQGASVELVEFAESERDKIIAMARRELKQEARRIKDRFESTLQSADKYVVDVEKTDADGGTLSPEKRREMLAKRGLSKAKKSLEAATEAAIAFDLLADVQELLDGISASVRSRFEAFFASDDQHTPSLFSAEEIAAAESGPLELEAVEA